MSILLEWCRLISANAKFLDSIENVNMQLLLRHRSERRRQMPKQQDLNTKNQVNPVRGARFTSANVIDFSHVAPAVQGL